MTTLLKLFGERRTTIGVAQKLAVGDSYGVTKSFHNNNIALNETFNTSSLP